MLLVPARTTVVVKTLKIAAKIDAFIVVARAALHIFQIGINLNALGELGRLNVHESGTHSAHKILLQRKRDTSRADRILEFVYVNTGIHNTAK